MIDTEHLALLVAIIVGAGWVLAAVGTGRFSTAVRRMADTLLLVGAAALLVGMVAG